MSIRRDLDSGRHVVLATERIPGPPDLGPGTRPVIDDCPFCPGHEDRTSPSIAERGTPWTCRAFANRFPGMRPEHALRGNDDPLQPEASATGAHEVLVLSRDHQDVSVEDRHAAMQLAADRLEDLRRDARFASVGWYENRGVEAGASQAHPHAQVVAMPVVPLAVRRWSAGAGRLGTLAERAADADRVVWRGGGVVGFTPWAPMAPFEVWVVPDLDVARFHEDRQRVHGAASALHAVTGALDGLFGWCARNAVLTDAPRDHRGVDARWRMRIIPRVVRHGGFEEWSGGSMHPMPPERAAALLRGSMT